MNICYCGVQAGYPHDADCPYPLFRGTDEDVAKWQAAYDAREAARELGDADGRSRASWYFGGTPTAEHALRVLRGLEDGDPAIADTLPSAPLSGEWANDPTPTTVRREIGLEDEDEGAEDALEVYEAAFASAVEDEITREARAVVLPSEPYAWPGGYPIVALVDDSEYLCARCFNDQSNPIHFGGNADEWRIEGFTTLEGSAEDYDGAVTCSHCNTTLVEGEES